MPEYHDDAPRGKKAQSGYANGRLTTHASLLGGCARAIVASALGYPQAAAPSYHNNLVAAGHLDEYRKKAFLAGIGVQIDSDQHEIELELPRATILGALYGIGSCADPSHPLLAAAGWDGSPAILELKSMSDTAFRAWPKKRFAGHEQYAVQISAYMHAMDLPALYAVSRRTDTPTAADFDLMLLRQPPLTREDLEARTETLVDCIEANADRHGEEVWPTCIKDKPRWCPYEYLHDGSRAADFTDELLGDIGIDLDLGLDLFGEGDGTQLETRMTMAESKRHEWAAEKRQHILALHQEALADIVPAVPPHGTSIHIVSNAGSDFWDFVPYLVGKIGPARMYASTWSMNRSNALELLDLLDRHQLLSADLLTGSYFKSREHAVYATLAAGLLERNQRILAFWNHSKVLVLINDTAAITVEGSANFTQNPRIEQYVVTHDRPLAEFHRAWMEEMLVDAARYAPMRARSREG